MRVVALLSFLRDELLRQLLNSVDPLHEMAEIGKEECARQEFPVTRDKIPRATLSVAVAASRGRCD